MPKLFIFLLSLTLVVSCRKDKASPTPPASVVKYKLNGNPVEIKGSAYDSVGSVIKSVVVREGTNSRNIYLLEAKNSSDFVRFNVVDAFNAGDTILYNHPNTSSIQNSILTFFDSKQYKITLDLGWPPATLTFIVDRVSNGTADGRFYGSAMNLYSAPNHPVSITEGEFKNVMITK